MSSLRQADPFFPGGCRFKDDNCPVEEGKDCSQQGILYEITCNNCTEPVDSSSIQEKESRKPGCQARYNYLGMTRCSVHYRMISHLNGQKSKSSKNPLYRHDRDVNGGVIQSYTTRILQKEKNLLPLCITEGLYIEKQVKGTSLNDKNEFGRGSLVRLSATRDVT